MLVLIYKNNLDHLLNNLSFLLPLPKIGYNTFPKRKHEYFFILGVIDFRKACI